ncbi:hypothetical protein AX16_002948 [Volvariella volvacea WC 439]|nr:hypothetical protein AX16_002948 [Volvariella volvacea WC 439]
MKFATSLLALVAFTVPAFAVPTAYDETYDNGGGSLLSVACSNGPHGLVTRGYDTFRELPTWPYIGGASAVTGWNSPKCGSCWQLTFNPGNGTRTIVVTAVDFAATGFNIALAAMNNLTDGHGIEYGVVNVTSTELPAARCGL